MTAKALERVSSLAYWAHLTIKGSRKGEDEIDAAVEMLIEIIMGNFAVHKKLKAEYINLQLSDRNIISIEKSSGLHITCSNTQGMTGFTLADF